MALVALALSTSLACEDTRLTLRRPPGTRVETFAQTEVPSLDVLWVVDNSASMAEEQAALAQNFGAFFEYLEDTGADYHIGVISTDVYSAGHRGQLQGEAPFISPRTPYAAEVFSRSVQVGTDGKGDEQGFRAALLALDEPLKSTFNAGFQREDAYLYVIFVSDEDDKSFGEVTYFERRFESLKGLGNDRMVNLGAVVELAPGSCPDASPGTRYAALAERVGGLSRSICEDFGGALDALGFSAAGLKRVFTLDEAALDTSVAVWVRTPCARPWQPAGLCVETLYDCGGSASEVFGFTCVLRQALPDGWGYEPETGSLRFFGAAVPPFGARIEVGYIPLSELP
jgi:hypothetical protein